MGYDPFVVNTTMAGSPDDSKWYLEHADHVYNCGQSFLPFQSRLTLNVQTPKNSNLDQSHRSTARTMTFPDVTTYTQDTTGTVDSPASSTNHVVSPHNMTLGQKSLMPDGKKQALTAGMVSEVDWLKDVVQKRPGCQAFIIGMNHNQQNLDMARSWRFAVTFAQKYNKTVSKGAVGGFLFLSGIVLIIRTGSVGQTGAQKVHHKGHTYILASPRCLAPSKRYVPWIYTVKGGVILPLRLWR